mmetsp:Transcript_21623/g.69704  ORF Transcript_21623/g.69704 Transcript_21623/m.69704 type:complete len:324 (-) Transcript_21623:973-1944(-)
MPPSSPSPLTPRASSRPGSSQSPRSRSMRPRRSPVVSTCRRSASAWRALRLSSSLRNARRRPFSRAAASRSLIAACTGPKALRSRRNRGPAKSRDGSFESRSRTETQASRSPSEMLTSESSSGESLLVAWLGGASSALGVDDSPLLATAAALAPATARGAPDATLSFPQPWPCPCGATSSAVYRQGLARSRRERQAETASRTLRRAWASLAAGEEKSALTRASSPTAADAASPEARSAPRNVANSQRQERARAPGLAGCPSKASPSPPPSTRRRPASATGAASAKVRSTAASAATCAPQDTAAMAVADASPGASSALDEQSAA